MIYKESETIELKSIVVDDVKKEIVAFANCEGGKLYIGAQDDGSIIGVEDPDGAVLQVSNMIQDAIKPDLTMFLHYTTLVEYGKQIVAIDIQQGTARLYYIAKKGLRPEGVFVRQGYSSVPATSAAIRRMIKETDGNHFEDMRSLEQNLTFEAAKKEFSETTQNQFKDRKEFSGSLFQQMNEVYDYFVIRLILFSKSCIELTIEISQKLQLEEHF